MYIIHYVFKHLKLLNIYENSRGKNSHKQENTFPLTYTRMAQEYESNWDKIVQPTWNFDHIGLFFYVKHRLEAYRDKRGSYFSDINSSETTVVKGNGLPKVIYLRTSH